MRFTAREVLVPVVAGDAATAVLARIVADGGLPAPHPAKLEPEISELLNVGLYSAGQMARAAVRRLRRRYWPRPHTAALSVANPGELFGLAEENARSAELGLALALLLFQSQASTRCVLATGSVSSVDGGKVSVLPVNHLHRKFATVEKHYLQIDIARPPVLMLVPETDPDGNGVAKRYAPEIERLAALGIAVQPVSDLSEAAERIDALRPAWPTGARATVATALAALLLVGLASAAIRALSVPIPLAFTDALLVEGGTIQQAPFRATRQPEGTWVSRPPCSTKDGLPAYRPNDQVMFAARAGDRMDWIGQLSGLYITLVAVTPGSIIKVMPINAADRAYAPGEPIFWAWPLTKPSEPGPILIAVLAQRLGPLDRDQLAKNLHSQLKLLEPAERLNGAQRYLEQIAPGAMFYYLREIGENEQCSSRDPDRE
jgi:hypothetical protein